MDQRGQLVASLGDAMQRYQRSVQAYDDAVGRARQRVSLALADRHHLARRFARDLQPLHRCHDPSQLFLPESESRRVYKQDRCHDCGAPVTESTVGGRTAYHCPVEQVL